MAEQLPAQRERRSATQRRVWLERAPSIAVRVYPNVIYVIQDGRDVLRMTPDQWAEMVEIVGIKGFAAEGSSERATCDDAAIERAARALCDEGIRALDGTYSTWERHADGFRAMAERALRAAGETP